MPINQNKLTLIYSVKAVASVAAFFISCMMCFVASATFPGTPGMSFSGLIPAAQPSELP